MKCNEFFYHERTARILLIFFALYCAAWIVLMVLGLVRPRQAILFMLAIVIWPTTYSVWLIWLGRRYPIFSLSEQLVEWREPESRKQSSISTADIIHAEKVTRHVVVFRTNSKGSLRIPLTGLSAEDREEIRQLIHSRFVEQEDDGQPIRTSA
jgi:hypothetical protein